MRVVLFLFVLLVFCSSSYSYNINDLFDAVRESNIEIIDKVLDQGVCINNKHELLGITPLMHAAYRGDLNIVKYLLSKGADVDVLDTTEGTALDWSLDTKNEELIKLLVLKSNISNEKKDSLLMWATQKSYLDLIKALLFKGAHVNFKGNNYFTPLHVASYHGHKNIVEYLLSQGAEVNVRADLGINPRGLAVQENHQNIVSLLDAINQVESNLDLFDSQSIEVQKILVKRWINQNKLYLIDIIYPWVKDNLKENKKEFFDSNTIDNLIELYKFRRDKYLIELLEKAKPYASLRQQDRISNLIPKIKKEYLDKFSDVIIATQ